jgi:hypothetical protein
MGDIVAGMNLFSPTPGGTGRGDVTCVAWDKLRGCLGKDDTKRNEMDESCMGGDVDVQQNKEWKISLT